MTDATVSYGIENSKKIFSLVIELGNVGDKIGHTSGTAKWSNLFNLFDEVTGMAGFSFDTFKKEVSNYSDAEKVELKTFFKDKFDLVDDKLEGFIEKAIDLIEKHVNLMQEDIAFVKSLKA